MISQPSFFALSRSAEFGRSWRHIDDHARRLADAASACSSAHRFAHERVELAAIEPRQNLPLVTWSPSSARTSTRRSHLPVGREASSRATSVPDTNSRSTKSCIVARATVTAAARGRVLDTCSHAAFGSPASRAAQKPSAEHRGDKTQAATPARKRRRRRRSAAGSTHQANSVAG